MILNYTYKHRIHCTYISFYDFLLTAKVSSPFGYNTESNTASYNCVSTVPKRNNLFSCKKHHTITLTTESKNPKIVSVTVTQTHTYHLSYINSISYYFPFVIFLQPKTAFLLFALTSQSSIMVLYNKFLTLSTFQPHLSLQQLSLPASALL